MSLPFDVSTITQDFPTTLVNELSKTHSNEDSNDVRMGYLHLSKRLLVRVERTLHKHSSAAGTVFPHFPIADHDLTSCVDYTSYVRALTGSNLPIC